MSAENRAGTGSRREHMPMRFDQPRHHHPAAAIDPRGAVGRVRRAGDDLFDAVAFDEQAEAVPQRLGAAVEQPEIGKHDRRGRGLGRRLLSGRGPGQPERCQRGAGAGDKAAPRQAQIDPPGGGLKLRLAAPQRGEPGPRTSSADVQEYIRLLRAVCEARATGGREKLRQGNADIGGDVSARSAERPGCKLCMFPATRSRGRPRNEQVPLGKPLLSMFCAKCAAESRNLARARPRTCRIGLDYPASLTNLPMVLSPK